MLNLSRESPAFMRGRMSNNGMSCTLIVGGSVSKKIEVKPKVARMGRPPVDEDLRRTYRVSVTVNRDELDAILAKADAACETASEWARKKLLEAK